MLGKFIAGDFIAIAGEMRRFPASNFGIYFFCGFFMWLFFGKFGNKFYA
jgi:hypothetical protein